MVMVSCVVNSWIVKIIVYKINHSDFPDTTLRQPHSGLGSWADNAGHEICGDVRTVLGGGVELA